MMANSQTIGSMVGWAVIKWLAVQTAMPKSRRQNAGGFCRRTGGACHAFVGNNHRTAGLSRSDCRAYCRKTATNYQNISHSIACHAGEGNKQVAKRKATASS
jgi:hypothetical protein